MVFTGIAMASCASCLQMTRFCRHQWSSIAAEGRTTSPLGRWSSLRSTRHWTSSLRTITGLRQLRSCDFGANICNSGSRFFSHGADDDVDLEPLEDKDQFAVGASDEVGTLSAGLYLVGTPIGNLEDITLRALRVLKSASLILAEDTRHSSRLLRHYNINTPTISFHKFNEVARREMVVRRLIDGEALALISDAGMPGISDPGNDIVKACVEANVKIFPVPGPSAVITAVVASGLPTTEFSFVGFLPPQSTARKDRLALCANQSSTQVFYTPPHKLGKVLDDCILAFSPSSFGGERYKRPATNFRLGFPEEKITLVIEGLSEEQTTHVDEDQLKLRLQYLLQTGKSPSEATKQVVRETSARKNQVYPLALGLIQEEKD